MITPHTPQSPIATFKAHRSTETPRPVFDGKRWHCFGQGVNESGKWEMYHSSSLYETGPWIGHSSINLDVIGTSNNVPGIIYENGAFNLFVGSIVDGVQVIEYYLSINLKNWYQVETILRASDDEVAICDPVPVIINDTRYIVYTDAVDQSRHVARSRSDTWCGPFVRLGRLPDAPAIH